MPDNAGEDVTPEAFKAWLEKLSGHSDSAGKADRKAGEDHRAPPTDIVGTGLAMAGSWLLG